MWDKIIYYVCEMAENKSEIRIRGVSSELKNVLLNIAKNCGYSTLTDFLKPKLRDVANSYAENLKRDFRV